MATVLLHNRSLYEEMCSRLTPGGETFDSIIQPGLDHPSLPGVGAFFGDERSYVKFKIFFDEIVLRKHGKSNQ